MGVGGREGDIAKGALLQAADTPRGLSSMAAAGSVFSLLKQFRINR